MVMQRSGTDASVAASSATQAWTELFERVRVDRGEAAALDWLVSALMKQGPAAIQQLAQQWGAQGHADRAINLLRLADSLAPGHPDARLLLGALQRQSGSVLEAEATFRRLLKEHPQHKDAAFNLASLLREGGRLEAASRIVAEFASARDARDVESLLQAAIFTRQCQRAQAALKICERGMAAGVRDSRLFYLASDIASSLGAFEQARRYMTAAMRYGVDLNQWYALQALAHLQRYDSQDHPDFALFEHHIHAGRLKELGLASALFALGKASDDIGDVRKAADCWRRANALVRAQRPWDAGAWKAQLDQRMNARPLFGAIEPIDDFVPVFIVGMPRSGTTLLAQLLGRHPQVCNRGELNWLPYIVDRLAQHDGLRQPGALHEASRLYFAHVRQDDPPRRWYVDKNPMNFLNVGYALSLFPNARILFCRRDPRDTALSIWSQFFAAGNNTFAYDFDAIREVSAGAERLLAHWRALLPVRIQVVDYEQLVADPAGTLRAVRDYLGQAEPDATPFDGEGSQAIGTSSVWQARQAVYGRSVGRWRHYAAYVPELAAFAAI
jgi:tetratricopeptide (TPR) repeat protein